MTAKTVSRKTVILPDGTRKKRIIQRLKWDNTVNHPTNIRGMVYINKKLVDVIPVDKHIDTPFTVEEWKVIE